MKWIGQHIYDLVSKFRNTVDFSEDVTFYQPVNNANPQISLGSSDDERLQISINYQGTTTQLAQVVQFTTSTESGTAHDGRFNFAVDEVNILKIQDGGIDFFADKGISINGTDILTDSSGTATLSNIDALDATTISTLNAALTAGDITGVTAGTGLSGGGTTGAVTLNVDAAQSGITSLGTLTGLTLDGDKSVTPGDGAMIHVGNPDITDSNTSASGTADKYTHVNIEAPRLAATNASVTTTDAATLYIKGAPSASTNQTITNSYALWVDSGDARFDGEITGTLATVSQPNVTTLAGLTTIGATGVNTVINSNDIQWYNAVNDGNPQLSIGSGANERLTIAPKYDSGAQTLDWVEFKTIVASGTANKGMFGFNVDGTATCYIDDGGINFPANKGISIDGTDILTDSSGTATLSNIDALDATTAATLKAALYSNSIISFTGQATMVSSGNWIMPGKGGISNHTWNKDISVNTETNGTSEAAVPKQWAQAGVRVPFACIVDGISCMIQNTDGNRQTTVGLFFARAADGTTAVDWGSGDNTEPILQIHADANNESGSYTNRPSHAEVTGSDIAMAAGDVFYPAIKLTGITSGGNTDSIYATFNVHIKTLLV